MKIIYNNIIPFPGYIAINICGLVFARRRYKPLSDVTVNHEAIHTAQMRELLYIGFYICYLIEWIYRLIFHTATAYEGISFEVEAYDHEMEMDYLENRKHYAQWRK